MKDCTLIDRLIISNYVEIDISRNRVRAIIVFIAKLINEKK